MPPSTSPTPSPAADAREFATTHWSLVLAAGGDTSRAQLAVARFCSIYWYPLYAFARRIGLRPPDAEDATQGFLVHLLQTNALATVAREKGRFRSFLLAALKNFLSHERERAAAQKRGGGERAIELDAMAAEARYALEPADNLSPDRLFDRGWALAVLEQAQERLRCEYDAGGKTALFEALRPTLAGARAGPAYTELATTLGMSEGAIKVAVHRLRDRYRAALRSIVAETVAAPADTAICYGDVAPLNAYIALGTSYTWNNTEPLSNQGNGIINSTPYTINAVASPTQSTMYVLSIMNSGCPNALRDTFMIHVHQKIVVDAGHDTAVVFNQPLQLNASSNDTTAYFYTWVPTTGLDDPNIHNPVAILGLSIDSVRYTVTAKTEEGCAGSATILVKVYKTLPDIFVPSAFTPGSAANSVFRPVPVGIATFEYFRVYNRYGQLVFSTSQAGKGWDGRVNGKLQDPATFVWMVQGISYQGKTVFHKGTVVLIR